MNIRKIICGCLGLVTLGLTFQSRSMLQENSPFTLNNPGLELVTKTLFRKVEYYIPTKLKDLGIRKVSNHKMLIATAIEKALAEADIPKALENPQPEQIAALTEQLKRILSNLMFELYMEPAELKWCSCPNAPESLRIALVVQIANDARKERDPSKHLVYTSIASGEMLLDYLIISELIHYGFKDIHVNFIELGLLDIPEMEGIIKQVEAASKKVAQPGLNTSAWTIAQQQEPHAENLLDQAVNARSYLAAFTQKVTTKAAAHQAMVGFNEYTLVDNYLARARKYISDKSDILILVDPSTGIYPLKDSIGAQAFSVQYKPDNEALSATEQFYVEGADSFIVFIPRTGVQDIKLYSNINFDSLSFDDPARALYKKISALIYETQDVAAIQQRLNKPFNHTPFIIHKAAVRFSQQEAGKNEEEELEDPYALAEEQTANPVTLYWISEAYLVLQDIIRAGLSNLNSAAVYQIAYPTQNRKEPVLERLSAREYQTKDVITPNIGAALTDDNYRLIPLAPEARREKKMKSVDEIADIRRKREEIKKEKQKAKLQGSTIPEAK